MSRLHDEQGATLVIVVTWLAVLVLVAIFVVDVGNWFEHKRHLQLEADAAAFAGADSYVIPCADQPIIDNAQSYSGVFDSSAWNKQVGGTPTSRLHMQLNSPTYWNQSSPVDGTVRTGGPCAAKMVDVKLTENDVPWFFKLAGVPYINAHARVELRQMTTGRNVVPIAINDTNPRKVQAVFIDERTGSKLAGPVDLSPVGTSNGLSLYDNATAPLSVPISTDQVGVRIILSDGASTTCGQPLVACYDASSSNGLYFIQGYDTSGTGSASAPKLRDTTLVPASCPSAQFFYVASSCTIGVSAKLDIGGADPNTTKTTVSATIAGKTKSLAYSNGRWTSDANSLFTIAAQAGAQPVTLSWKTTNSGACTSKSPCTGTFGTTGAPVQRAFSGSDAASGPIQLMQVGAGSPPPESTALPKRTSQSLVVRIGLPQSLQVAQSVNDPVVAMRFTGSQNHAIDCDPAQPNLADELANGCGPTYAINTGTACPSWNNGFPVPQPWTCVVTQTGNATNQIPTGLNQRILGSTNPTTCNHPNQWSQFPNFSGDDPRIVQVFITPSGSFEASGNDTFPIVDFATFYITGWRGNGNGGSNPCTGNGDDPVPDGAFIVGHFIKYIQKLNNGSGGTQVCDLNSFGSCVAILTE